LEQLERRAFDLVVSDMLMPEMDGLDLGLRIEERWPQIPFVLASSLPRREVLEDGRLASTGAVAVIAKPVKTSALLDALVTALGGRGAPQHAAEGGTAMDPEMGRTHPLRILLAEDNVVNQKLAVRLLEKMGYRADVVGNGIETLQALERQSYDLLLTDVQMPEMDGLEATREIVRRWPAGERPRIVGVTAEAMAGDRDRCIEAGMDDYITKPIRPDELVTAIRRVPSAVTSATGGGGSGNGASSEDGGPIDAATLRRFVETMGEDDPGFIQEMIDQFLGDAPGLVETLRVSIDADDAEGVRRAAHTLKSNANTFGALALGERCAALETAARSHDLTAARATVQTIAEDLARIQADLPAAWQAIAAD